MRSVLFGAVVLCLLQCCTAVPLEEFVGYPFSNETHQVHRILLYYYYYYNFPVNISQPFVIDGRGMTGFWVSYSWMLNVNVILPTTPAPPALLQCSNTLIARSSVLGVIIIFKLELYVLRYLRIYCATVCHHVWTVHGSVPSHKVEHECIDNLLYICTHTNVVM